MPSLRTLAVPLLIAAIAVAQDAPDPQTPWLPFLGRDGKQPTPEQLPAYLTQLSAMLGAPDPKLRDDTAYVLLANWIYRDRIVPVPERQKLLRTWSANLDCEQNAGDQDRVLLRSFSALCLGTLVLLDNEAPYLTKAEFDELLGAACNYLLAEVDVRGYDPTLGWLHSTAHTADLLKFLARSRHLEPAQQRQILTRIADKLNQTPSCYTAGEDQRLARALLALTARPDFATDTFAGWLKSFAQWRYRGDPAAILAKGQNRRHLLSSLYVLLATDERDKPGITIARAALLTVLKGG